MNKVLTLLVAISLFTFSCGESQKGDVDGGNDSAASADSGTTASEETPNYNTDPSKDIFEQPNDRVMDISLDEMEELITGGGENYNVIDVRTPEEWAQGVIGDPLKIDWFDANWEKEIYKLDKNRLYAVYCAAGGRSSKAVKKMKELGFAKVYNLPGGFGAWQAAGKPVNKN